jgi:hypothetical protein
MSNLVALGREIHPSVGRAGRDPGRDEAASAQRGGMPMHRGFMQRFSWLSRQAQRTPQPIQG